MAITIVSIIFMASIALHSSEGLTIPGSNDPCICTKELSPVCSTKGEQFSNECVLNCVASTDPSIKLDCKQPCPCPSVVSTTQKLLPQFTTRLPTTRFPLQQPSLGTKTSLRPTTPRPSAPQFTQTEAPTDEASTFEPSTELASD